MPRPVLACAVSVVLHGAGALALVSAGRPDSFTPLVVIDVLLPDAAGTVEPAKAMPAPPAPRRAVVAPPRGRPAAIAPVTPTAREATSLSDPVPSVVPVVTIPPIATPPPREADAIVRWEPASASAPAPAAPTPGPIGGGASNGSASGPPGSPSGTVNAALVGAAGGSGSPAQGSAAGGGRSEPATLAAPRYDDNATPAYPWQARLRGDQGMVLLSVLVDRRGQVSDLRVEQSSGSRVLDDAAVDAVRRWTFRPGRRGIEPVESWVQVPVRFRLDD